MPLLGPRGRIQTAEQAGTSLPSRFRNKGGAGHRARGSPGPAVGLQEGLGPGKTRLAPQVRASHKPPLIPLSAPTPSGGCLPYVRVILTLKLIGATKGS